MTVPRNTLPLAILLVMAAIPFAGRPDRRPATALPADILAAREYCDTSPLAPVEGIWSYPEDGVTVLVRRAADGRGFDVVAIESEDVRIHPGDAIGSLHPSVDPRQFRLVLDTDARRRSLIRPAECLATLTKDGSAMTVRSRKLSLKINASWILPRFWRIVRISSKDPLDDLPAGMIRIYPSYDGNGSNPHEPRYL